MEDLLSNLNRRPAVHRLTSGAFLKGPVWINPRTLVVPLMPMGFGHAVAYACQYEEEILNCSVLPQVVERLAAQGKDAMPVLAFARFVDEERSPELMEAEAMPDLVRAEQLVGWISGDYLQDFALIVAATDEIYVRTVPPQSRRRLLLGPGNTGTDLKRNIDNIRDAADRDVRFAFALSLYRDALHETNKQFKIARLFSVLEALAYALKSGDIGSRDAVRKMLRLENGATGEISYGGRSIRYERVVLAGRLRDSLFHGAPFTREDMRVEFHDSYDLLTDQPDALISDLMADCELEFARWGNNASVARTAAEGGRV